MKKHLLLLVTAAMTSLSSFALGEGEKVYTPNGRYETTSGNLSTANLTTLENFVVVPSTTGEIENIIAKGTDEVVGDYIQTLSTQANTTGIAYKLPINTYGTYLVSMKVKAASRTATYNSTADFTSGMNGIRVISVAKDANLDEAEVVSYYSSPVTLFDSWTTIAFSLDDVDATSDYYVEFLGMDANVLVADVSFNSAEAIPDLRKKESLLKVAKAYLDAENWSQDVLDDTGLKDNYEFLEGMDDNSTMADFLAAVESLTSSFEDIQKKMDNWLGSDFKNILGPSQAKTQGQTNWGIWTFRLNDAATNRLYGEAVGSYMEGPHYNGSGTFPNSCGLETTAYQEFPAGSYVFTVDMNAATRAAKGKWGFNLGLQMAEGELYLINENNDTVATSGLYELPSGDNAPTSNYVKNVLTWKLSEGGKYKLGMRVTPIPGVTLFGGSATFKDATLYYVSSIAYTKAQLDYISDVKAQILAGRDALTAAEENQNDVNLVWGKKELQECMDTVAPKILDYEALDTAAILSTFDGDTYVKTTSEESGQLYYTIYQVAVKDILAANRTFAAKNDTIAQLERSIEQSIALQQDRVYANALEGEQLANEITVAQTLLEQMKSTDYSVENAAAIKEELAKLAAARNVYMASIDPTKISTLVDVDFSGTVNYVTEESEYATTPGEVNINGKTGVMNITNFMTTTPPNDIANSKGVLDHCSIQPYELGVDDNGAKILSDFLHVGTGDALVSFETGDMGSDILKISMDWWLLRLSGNYVGFYMLNENSENVSGLVFNTYNNNSYTYNPLSMPLENGSKGYIANTTENVTNDNNKTNMVLYLDYGTKKAKLVNTIPSGSTETEWVPFSGDIVTAFKISSKVNGGYNGRRCWFDNLKIERIAAAEVVSIVGDANGDGQVTMADANAIVNYFLAEDKTTITNFDVTAADVNGDGEISMADANAAVNIFLGITVE